MMEIAIVMMIGIACGYALHVFFFDPYRLPRHLDHEVRRNLENEFLRIRNERNK